MLLFLLQEAEVEPMNPKLKLFFIIVFFIGMASIVLSRLYVLLEQAYIGKFKKPFFIHFYLLKRRLNSSQEKILQKQFSFYKKLPEKQKFYFQHRVASFIKSKKFVGRENLKLTDEIVVLISATAVMLTFGFRNYKIDLLENIVIYPKEFYSKINEAYHKGEFNPKLKTMALSWKDFQEGYKISNDNLNLGIHEITHAIHLNSLQHNDISSLLFIESFNELTIFLSNNENLKKELIASKYFRDYAFTNHFEFLAVIIENFIETSQEFKSQFPEIYALVRQMLNFKFKGY